QTEAGRGRARLREGGVYLITGGLGGVGMVLAEELARSARAKLVLTGRRDFPPRAQWESWLSEHEEQDEVSLKISRLLSWEAQGAEASVVRADVAVKTEMQEVVRQTLERFGRIDGVIHAAGVSGQQAFRAIPETGRDEVEQHFRAKAHGLLVLQEVLAGL